MSRSEYVLGILSLAAVLGGISAGAIGVRRRWLPRWSGASARLAEVIVGVALMTWISEALGTIGQLNAVALVVVTIAVGAYLWRMGSRVAATSSRPDHSDRTGPRWSRAVAGVYAAGVGIFWVINTRGAYKHGLVDTDSLAYHLPIAMRFAQTGNTTQLHFMWFDPVWSFYPANNELLNAVGMVLTGRDILAPLLNLLWFGIAVLSAWVIGRRYGIGHLTVGATLVVLASPFVAKLEAGSALNDTAAIALALAAIALLFAGDRDWPSLAIAGLAAGLAIGTKITAVGPMIAVWLVLIATAPRGARVRTATVWAAAAFAGGGYWFVKNLVRAGNPVPCVHVPGLPSPSFPVLKAHGHAVLEYVTTRSFWSDFVRDGLRLNFGPYYVVVLPIIAAAFIVALVGLVRSLRSHVGDRDLLNLRWTLLFVAVLGALVYSATPGSAFGDPGVPWQFGLNLRYSFSALVAAASFGALACARCSSRVNAVATTFVGIALALEIAYPYTYPYGRPSVFAALPAVALVVVVSLLWPAMHRAFTAHRRMVLRAVPVAVVVGFIAFSAIGWKLSEPYLGDRLPGDALAAWGGSVHDARIAFTGVDEEYRLAGPDLSNRLDYLGQRGSNGQFGSFTNCPDFRAALHSGNYDYFVVESNKYGVEFAEYGWEQHDPASVPVLDTLLPGDRGPTVVYKLTKANAPTQTGCP